MDSLGDGRFDVSFPLFKICNREERKLVYTVGSFDNRCDKFLQKPIVPKEFRPEEMQEVDDKTFDMRAVMVLIGHDHDRPVS